MQSLQTIYLYSRHSMQQSVYAKNQRIRRKDETRNITTNGKRKKYRNKNIVIKLIIILIQRIKECV